MRFAFCFGVRRTPCEEQTLKNKKLMSKPPSKFTFSKKHTIFRQRFRQKGLMAGPAGFEPATTGSEGRRHIP
jgi:hypothetical protein